MSTQITTSQSSAPESNPTIFLSNDRVFHTVEGEGLSIGKPAVFMRMAMCNLTCSGWASPENPDGCDSKVSWKVKNKFTFDELFKYYEDRGYNKYLRRGDILKLTGGEPFLQEKALYTWCQQAWMRWCKPSEEIGMSFPLNIEFETNATLVPKLDWQGRGLSTKFICSPKLSNNGDPAEKRYNVDALAWHAGNIGSYFKFVVCTKADLDELNNLYIDRFNIRRDCVWLMPECATTAQFKEKAPWVAEMCKYYGFNFSTRLQIMIWEKALGV